MKKARGRPVLGGFAGFFFFFFLALTLLSFGVLPLNSPALTVLPVIGILVGVAWAYVGPVGPRTPPAGWHSKP